MESAGNWSASIALSRRDLERKLAEVERRLARQPRALTVSIDDLYARGQLLEALGRNEEAREAYFALVAAAPTHFGGLNNLGNVLTRAGKRRAAQAAYEEAVKHHPDKPLGHVSLGICLMELEQFAEARKQFEAALQLDPENAAAHKGLSYLLGRIGEFDAAREHQRRGFGAEPIERLRYLGSGAPVEVLVLVSATGGNMDAESLLDKRVFAATKLYVEYHDPSAPLPDHDVVLNAISDADVAGDALQKLPALLAHTDAPILNPPQVVIPTGRAEVARRLRTIPGVVAPRIELLSRELLERDGAEALGARGFRFPLLLRLPQQHTGRHFVMVERGEDLAGAVAGLPGRELFAIEYLDARGSDGQARKYRVMFVDGKLYPLHLAVSAHWKIHYFSADMTENAANRAEDERFLRDMPHALGQTAVEALERVCRELALDYGGIDFGLNAAGEVLLFEANATMVVAAPGADPRWDYRRPAVQAIQDAVKAMLLASGKSALPG